MNFEKLFNDYKITYSTKINKGWINTNCPYCDTKIDSFNMGFNPIGDYCSCWKCGSHNLYETLSKLLQIKKSLIPEILKEYEGRNQQLNILNNKKSNVIKIELPTDTFTIQERKYLKNRNFNPKLLHDKYKIVGGGITGKWKYRIIIPLMVNNKIISWTGRSILNKKQIKELEIPRYKNLSVEQSILDPKSTLYNLDNSKGKSVILTEGAFDVIRLGDNSICSFGTQLTQSQINEIKIRYEKVFILFDNEKEARDKARKFGLQLSSIGVDVEIVDAYSDFNKNDAGELTDEEVKIIKKELNIY